MFIQFIIVALVTMNICNLNGMYIKGIQARMRTVGNSNNVVFFLSINQRTELYLVVLLVSAISGSLSHGMARPQGCGCRNGLQYGG